MFWALLSLLSSLSWGGERTVETFLRERGVPEPLVQSILFDLPMKRIFPTRREMTEFWEDMAGWGVEDVGAFLAKEPSILKFNRASRLETVLWIGQQGVTERSELVKILSMYPNIFAMSVKDNLEAKADWLRKLRVRDIRRILLTRPSVFAQSFENWDSKVAFFREKGIRRMGPFIERASAQFGLSLENNLRPTWEELVTNWGITPGKIESHPIVLSASLPRVTQLRAKLEEFSIELRKIPMGIRIILIQEGSVEHWEKNFRSQGLNPQDPATVTFLFKKRKLARFLTRVRSRVQLTCPKSLKPRQQ